MSAADVSARPAVAATPAGAAGPSSPKPSGPRLSDRAESRVLCGWGRTAPSLARVLRPHDAAAAAAALADAAGTQRGVIARGAGRSYGDAAQNGGGLVLDMTALSSIQELAGRDDGALRVGAGTTLAQLMTFLTARAMTVPVTPGTKHITVGGAIAADIHGKNHFRDGSFGHHVESLELCTPAGEVLHLSRAANPELFYATVGGMGLTGVVLEAVLRPHPLPAAELWADIERTDDFDGALALLAEDSARHRFSIAWLDVLGDRPRLGAHARFGRAVVIRSDYAPPGSSRAKPELADRPRLAVPPGTPGMVLNPTVLRAYNALHWHSAPRRARQRALGMNAHFFPLDALQHWNRLYGKSGLVQYQFVVPRSADDALVAVLEGLRRERIPMYLVVLKRFGAGSGGLLSFPMEGFTLAIDVPAGAPVLASALARADQRVLAAGGRVYLAKDSRLAPEMLAAMYPELERFKGIRSRVDPRGVLQSDMSRRLGLAMAGRGSS
jgi:decaprenylphospho-beta-D-ribofuranose 2-oxidase